MHKICLVDDNMTNLTLARDILKTSYKVYPAPSAAKFFEIIENIRPDLILMDVDMPQMSGYEAVQILKNDERFANIPVIFLTAKTDEESELKGFKLGAVDYITKPFHQSIVKARIATHLTIVEQRRIIEKISLTDPLTQIPNRRFFDSEMAKEWKRAIRDGLSIGLMMIDADYFKKFNDEHGHQQGDAALQTLATVISSSIKRGTDFAARWGGEEFAVLLPNTGDDGISKVAENIRLNVEKTAVPCVDDPSQGLNITVSLGCASIKPSDADSIEDFVKKADSALYTAKQKGRNRFYLFK
ncbi:MAG: diguanylate cyclase [Spirochaetes bacterium]|nr:diguanylate cyclase [Spirochaetota bacterium]